MKLKMLTALAAIALTTGGAYAASDMKGCCQGEECCCDKMKQDDMGQPETPAKTPAPEAPAPHQH